MRVRRDHHDDQLTLFTDVHVDVNALQEGLVQLDQLKRDLIVFAGDLVDWSCRPGRHDLPRDSTAR